jgi:DNA adenine methylase
LDSPIKWPGGKHYLAPKLWALARKVPHLHRVEVFGGSLAFTLAAPPEGYSEVVNDLNGDLTNFWRILQEPTAFDEFCRRIEAMPFSEAEWQRASDATQFHCPVGRAIAFFVRCRQSLAGRMDVFAAVSRTRTRRGMNEQASAWLNAVEGLPAVHERLKRVLVLNRPGLEVIRSQDGKKTLFYLDPPYMHETRTTTYEYGDFEMSEHQHTELLTTLAGIEGKFILSGYNTAAYERAALGQRWSVHTFELPNNAAGGKEKRRMKEYVWANF